jgi:hypothetical protein
MNAEQSNIAELTRRFIFAMKSMIEEFGPKEMRDELPMVAGLLDQIRDQKVTVEIDDDRARLRFEGNQSVSFLREEGRWRVNSTNIGGM